MNSRRQFITQLSLVGGGMLLSNSLSAHTAGESFKRIGVIGLDTIAQTTLTVQLRELERDGIISRKIYAETPPRVEYKLSELGQTLLPILELLDDWWALYKTSKTDAI